MPVFFTCQLYVHTTICEAGIELGKMQRASPKCALISIRLCMSFHVFLFFFPSFSEILVPSIHTFPSLRICQINTCQSGCPVSTIFFSFLLFIYYYFFFFLRYILSTYFNLVLGSLTQARKLVYFILFFSLICCYYAQQ
jgi:hypothetical protein